MTGSSYPIGSLPDQRSEQTPFNVRTRLYDKLSLCAEPAFSRGDGVGGDKKYLFAMAMIGERKK